MKRIGTISKVGRAILISTLIFAVNLRAQNVVLHRPFAGGSPLQPLADSGGQAIDRIAEADWIRGYRDGYQLGLWTGIQDVRAMLPPVIRPPGYGTHGLNTAYRQGYFTGYADGYRRAFAYPWPLRSW
jgi:hypothetical protein